MVAYLPRKFFIAAPPLVAERPGRTIRQKQHHAAPHTVNPSAAGTMRSAVSCEPLVVSFVLSLILSLALRLLPQRTGTAPDFAPGVEVSIRSGTSGKYVEVGDNLWLYASYYSHNKPSCRFEVHEADASLVRTLTGTREYRESAGARSGWDVRGADASREADAFPGATGVDDSPEEYRPEGDWPSTADESSPLAREDEEDEEEVGALDGTAEAEEEGEIIGAPLPLRRLLFSTDGATAPQHGPKALGPPGRTCPSRRPGTVKAGSPCLRQPTHTHTHTPTQQTPTQQTPTPRTPLSRAHLITSDWSASGP